MLSYSGITVLSFANKVVKVQPQKFVCSLYKVPTTLQYFTRTTKIINPINFFFKYNNIGVRQFVNWFKLLLIIISGNYRTFFIPINFSQKTLIIIPLISKLIEITIDNITLRYLADIPSLQPPPERKSEKKLHNIAKPRQVIRSLFWYALNSVGQKLSYSSLHLNGITMYQSRFWITCLKYKRIYSLFWQKKCS